jgi:hypothetical protein
LDAVSPGTTTAVARLAQSEERKQEIKGQRRHNAHIDGGNRFSVNSQKSLSGLRRRPRRSRQIFRGLGHLKTTIDLRPPCPISRCPTQEDIETSAMPPQDGLRLDYLGHAEQDRPELGY